MAGSSEVGKVSSGKIVGIGEKIPNTSTPNSVVQKRDGDKVIAERYYNEKGEPYLDIDYTDHGNPKRHPIVPHKHSIKYENGTLKREEPGKAIK
jgi:hypothetical protein